MKINKLFLGLFFLSFFLLSSCEDENATSGGLSTVNVRFKALYGGNPLVMNERYTYNGKALAISKINFFVSDLVLVKGNFEASIKEIDLIDFTSTNQDLAGAENGVIISSEVIPSDVYDGIKFGIGVSSDLNAQSPSDFSPNHPLSDNFWSGWNSYIFHQLEGRFDEDSNPADLEEPFVYHIGFDQYFRERTFSNLEINVQQSLDNEIVIEIDILKILKDNDGVPLNLINIDNIHSSGNEEYVDLFANNWMNAFSF